MDNANNPPKFKITIASIDPRNVINLIVRALGGAGMAKYLFRRILAAIPVLFAIILITFALLRALPGGPFDFAGTKSVPPTVKAAREARYGLDKPFLLNLPNDGSTPDIGKEMRVAIPQIPLCDKLRAGVSGSEAVPTSDADVYEGWYLLHNVKEYKESSVDVAGKPTRCVEQRTVLYSDLTRSQFFQYLFNVMRFDFGPSLAKSTLDTPVTDLIAAQLPISMKIGLYAVLLGFLFGIPLGVLAAIYRNTVIDYTITLVSVFFASVPALALGPLLIYIFIVKLGVLPPPDTTAWKIGDLFNWQYLGRAILPIGVLAFGVSAGIARLTRASLLQTLRDDYIRTARSKGIRERSVLYIHALKNALIPVATIIGPLLAGLLTGTLIIERIFAIPGLGSAFVDSVTTRDYTQLLGLTILYSIFLIVGNIMVDVMYTWLDPRIRFD